MARAWSTSDAADPDRFAHWREMICAAFLALTPESDLRADFAGTVTQLPLGALSLARIDSRRQRVGRTGPDIARAPRPGYYANLQLSGVSEVAQGGRAAILHPGDLTVVDTGEPFLMTFPDDFRQLTFFLPGSLLAAQVAGPVRTATRIGTGDGLGAALRHLLRALPAADPSVGARLAVHAGGLLAAALSVPDVRPTRSPRTHRAAVADIDEHLTDDDLSPAATARRLGISVRRLHGLFAGQDLTFAATVRRARLARAHRDLRDPERHRLRIIDIAADAGFADVTSFHRAFRREYGRTPAEVRSASAQPRRATVASSSGQPNSTAR